MSIYLHRNSILILYQLFISSIIFGIILILTYSNVEATSNICDRTHCDHPVINDPNLKLEMVFQGDFKFEANNLSPVSSMAFLGPNDILVLNKNDGKVYRILNGTLVGDPVLDVNVANKRERGLLGIASSKDNDDKIYVYLYFTESEKGDGGDVCPDDRYSYEYHCKPDNEPIGNRLYKYELKNDKLVSPKLLLDLPTSPSPSHNGGVVTIGPDNNLYATIGDLLGGTYVGTSTKAQNLDESNPDGRSGILRITQDGNPVDDGILGKSMPVRLYYAYGIRNSFGIDFDPLTGNLWDTENGPEYGDEINLVHRGFNSGWERIQGVWEPIQNRSSNMGGLIQGDELSSPKEGLEDFGGRGKYSSPEFAWKFPIGITAAKFLTSDKLGKKYQNDLFVASFTLGKIFHFDLNKDRKGLKLSGSLNDNIADNNKELNDIIFAQGVGAITDIDIGPDGYMYVLSNYMGKPTIFRIVPNQNFGPLKSILNLPADTIDLLDKNHTWKSFGHANITQKLDNLTIQVDSDQKNKMYNRAFLQTELNLKKPLLLSMDYSIKADAGNATYAVEIRDSNSSEILFDSVLENLSSSATDKTFLLPTNIIEGKPLEFRVYVITQGIGQHIITMSKLDISQF